MTLWDGGFCTVLARLAMDKLYVKQGPSAKRSYDNAKHAPDELSMFRTRPRASCNQSMSDRLFHACSVSW
eukprot:6196741-Pleurochrysis_carterae.AAC.1